MKNVLVFVALLLGIIPDSRSQNTDLPGPTANLQTLPPDSYIIAMDNTNQLNSSGLFNLKAYGLVVYLLNNDIKVKWVITAGKLKDGIDFTVNSDQIKPTLNSVVVSRNFKGGPFIIFSSDTAGVAALINAYYVSNSLTGSNRPNVYRNTVPVTVDVRYDLTGFKPSAAILKDGGNQNIHLAYMTAAGIPSSNYTTISGLALLSSCYTFASEPHNSTTGSTTNTVVSNIRSFVVFGGNFLAQCAAVSNYENNALGRFQTTAGITVTNTAIGTTVLFPNPDLSYSQFEGVFNGSLTGSVENWQISTPANNEHDHVTGTGVNNTSVSASVSKMVSGTGGLVFYLGNHNYSTADVQNTNGIRMYMNAFLTPARQICPFVLPVSLLDFEGSLQNGKPKLQWTIPENQNFDHFNVEKSAEGTNYSIIGQVLATSAGDMQSYSFTDPEILNGTGYYRLEMVGKNNDIGYSQTISLTNDQQAAAFKITGLTNPFVSTLTFTYTSSENGTSEISIYTTTGTRIFERKISTRRGANLVSFTIDRNVASGLYLLELSNDKQRTVTKLIKL